MGQHIATGTSTVAASNQNVGYTPNQGLGGSDRRYRRRDTLCVFHNVWENRVGNRFHARVMMSVKREHTHLRCHFDLRAVERPLSFALSLHPFHPPWLRRQLGTGAVPSALRGIPWRYQVPS